MTSRRDLLRFGPDMVRSLRYPMKSRPNLIGSGQISARMIKPETDLIQPKTNET